MEPVRLVVRRGAVSMPTRPALLAALVLAIAACVGPSASPLATGTPAASAGPSSPPSGAPTSSPRAFGAIEHATGATDVLLRYEEGGGFVPVEWTAASAPIFTLYGDGTIIFRNLNRAPPPAVGSTRPFQPFRTARMNEEQIQALLEYALGIGGLETARTTYANDRVADASTATFSVNAGGLAKTVSVYALGIDVPDGPDLPARAAFGRLRDHLVDIDQGGSIKTDVYAPDRYRATLLEGQAGAADQKPWPWKDIKPTDFVADGDPNAIQLPARVLTAADAALLGITPFEGGFVGLPLAGPADGKLYSLSLRPLLPDETK